MLLPLRSGILRLPSAIQSALITYPDTFRIESLRMRPDSLHRPGRFNIPILADIEMIPRPVESPPAMTSIKVMLRKLPVLPRSGAVNHN